jgi:FkbM family methyltransferase
MAAEGPWDILRRKDYTMREVFDGILRATCPDIICDIGSCDGDESAHFKKVSPGSRIVAFEANRQNIDNFLAHRPDLDGVIVENAAVCDIDGEIEFHVLRVDRAEELWRRAAGSISMRNDDIPYTLVNTRSVRLDTYFRHDLLDNRTFALWIDVEGALDRVLAGARDVLSRTILIRAEVERKQFWQDQKLVDDITSTMQRAGFMTLADSWTPEASEQSDILLLNQNWLELSLDLGVDRSSVQTDNEKLRTECSNLQSIVAQTISERDAIAAASARWFTAVIAPDHNPLALASRRHHSWWRKLMRRFNHARPSAVALANRACADGKWELAVRYYRDALDVEPNNPDIWEQCGHALKKAGKPSEAEVAYQRMRELAGDA